MRRLLALALLTLAAHTASAELLLGQVVGVADGDTITVLDVDHTQHKIRLAGIDAPESRQAFGSRSRQHLAVLVFRRQVEVAWHKVDRYGRLVGKVRVDGADVSLKQLEAGLAWHYLQYAREQTETDRLVYAGAERAAREERRGLWAEAHPVAPWEFRRVRVSSQ